MVATIKPLLNPGSTPTLDPQENHLLAALPPAVQSRLFPHMELVPLTLRSLLYEAGRPMRHVYFPADSIISMQFLLQSGASTAISIVGNEGLLGIGLFLGFEPSRSRSLVQSAGHDLAVGPDRHLQPPPFHFRATMPLAASDPGSPVEK